ncbi:hypothetical protein BGX26_003123 [Mortierella sp. AD094]|nr:hypothetical protein BGX26_003123 [Mortierella sp. AD094]
MRFSIAAVAASLLSVVMAQQAYPTVPVEGTVWVAGQSPSVEWKLTNPADKTAMTIDLFKGDPTHQTQVQSFGSAPAGATKFKITLPATLAADYYSIRIGDAFSHYFTIKSSAGVAPTGTMPAPPVANATTTASISLPTTTPSKNTTTTTAGANTTLPTPTGNSSTVAKPTSGANSMAAGPMVIAAALVAAAMAL